MLEIIMIIDEQFVGYVYIYIYFILQAFLFPFQEGSTEAIRRVIHIYSDWFKVTLSLT